MAQLERTSRQTQNLDRQERQSPPEREGGRRAPRHRRVPSRCGPQAGLDLPRYQRRGLRAPGSTPAFAGQGGLPSVLVRPRAPVTRPQKRRWGPVFDRQGRAYNGFPKEPIPEPYRSKPALVFFRPYCSLAHLGARLGGEAERLFDPVKYMEFLEALRRCPPRRRRSSSLQDKVLHSSIRWRIGLRDRH